MRIFISAVTSEFGKARDAIASDLRARGHIVHVQSDFKQSPDSEKLLGALAEYIRDCHAVFCIIGKRCGFCPPRRAAERFQEALPEGIKEASYTQWEFFLARHFNRRRYRYIARDDYTPDQKPAVFEKVELETGGMHPHFAGALNNLAQLLQDTNQLDEAAPLMRRALAIVEKSFGPDHPRVATGLNSLAALLQATNRLVEAEPLMRRALAIDENSFGPDHPNVAIRLNNLAQVLQATNRLVEAEPLMRRAVAIVVEFTRRTGHRHPHLDAAFANYAGLLAAMGKDQAEIDAAGAALMRPLSSSPAIAGEGTARRAVEGARAARK